MKTGLAQPISHLGVIAEIEQESCPEPLGKGKLDKLLTEGLGMLVKDERRHIQGYLIYGWPMDDRYLIRAMAVRPGYQRRGAGRKMIHSMVSKLNYSRRDKIIALVDHEDLGTQLFFRAVGFKAIDILNQGSQCSYVFEYLLGHPVVPLF